LPRLTNARSALNVRYLEDVDVFLARWDEWGNKVYIGALDRDTGEEHLRVVNEFSVGSTTTERLRNRSVLVRNDVSHFSVIGRAASGTDIVATRFTPFRVGFGMTADAVDGPYLRGENAVLHVTIDNRVPEGGLAKLAVAHDIALRLDFGGAEVV